MDNVGVTDALSMWLYQHGSLFVIQTMCCVNREWGQLLKGAYAEGACREANDICQKWFDKTELIKHQNIHINDYTYINARRLIRLEFARLFRVSHCAVLELRQCGLSREHASLIVKALQNFYRQKNAIRQMAHEGTPLISLRFLKSLNSGMCVAHGTKCARTRRRICINNNYQFEYTCRCRISIKKLECISPRNSN